jgi:RNA polymerase sigma factor (sigma-70 family)
VSLQGAINRLRAETKRPAESGEGELLAGVQRSDVQAFERLYRTYQPRLARFLTQMLRRPQLVEEVLNDTMMAVWQGAGNFRGDSKLSTWVFAIAYRKALKARLCWPDPVQDDILQSRPSLEPGADHHVQHQKLRDALVGAMARLSPEHRAVVDLTYFHDLGYREIAEIVDCPVDTVKTRMFYARRRLRQALPGDLADWV